VQTNNKLLLEAAAINTFEDERTGRTIDGTSINRVNVSTADDVLS